MSKCWDHIKCNILQKINSFAARLWFDTFLRLVLKLAGRQYFLHLITEAAAFAVIGMLITTSNQGLALEPEIQPTLKQ